MSRILGMRNAWIKSAHNIGKVILQNGDSTDIARAAYAMERFDNLEDTPWDMVNRLADIVEDDEFGLGEFNITRSS